MGIERAKLNFGQFCRRSTTKIPRLERPHLLCKFHLMEYIRLVDKYDSEEDIFF